MEQAEEKILQTLTKMQLEIKRIVSKLEWLEQNGKLMEDSLSALEGTMGCMEGKITQIRIELTNKE